MPKALAVLATDIPIMCVPGCPKHGTVIRALRGFTTKTVDEETEWRAGGSAPETGHESTW